MAAPRPDNDPAAHRHASRPTGDHRHDHSVSDPEQIERVGVEAELLAPLTDTAIGALKEVRADRPTAAVLDIGSGPGVGTCQLAAAFPTASVIAVDTAPAALAATDARADRLGLADRVSTRCLDIGTGADSLPDADVCWASMAIHHVGNEVGLMTSLRDRLSADGVLCVVEWCRPPQPVGVGDLGRPGLWERLDSAWQRWFSQMRSGLPGWVPSRPYPTMMSSAGFTVIVAETIGFELKPPLNPVQRAFGARWLLGAAERLQPYADPADLTALVTLLTGGENQPVALVSSDIGIGTTRTLTLGSPRRTG